MVIRMHALLLCMHGRGSFSHFKQKVQRGQIQHQEAEDSGIRGSADRAKNTSEGRGNDDETGPLIFEGRHQRERLHSRQALLCHDALQPRGYHIDWIYE